MGTARKDGHGFRLPVLATAPANASVAEAHDDVARAGIDRIFDQFLERRRRTFDHLAGSNAVDQMLGEPPY